MPSHVRLWAALHPAESYARHFRFREDWIPPRIHVRAARMGPNVTTFAEVVMRERRHPEQGYGLFRCEKIRPFIISDGIGRPARLALGALIC